MQKQVLPQELAEIVTGLLINPDLLGELDSPERYQSFFLDIGRVVADHSGGEADWVNAGAESRPKRESVEYDVPMLSVSPNDSLPSLERNVWSLYDPNAWLSDEGADSSGEPDTEQDGHSLRLKLQGLLTLGHCAESNVLTRTMDILSAFLNSSDLDLDYQISDCIECFGDYEWMPAVDIDKERFDQLLAKGVEQQLTEDECLEFLGLVDHDSESHLVHKMIQAKNLLRTLEVMSSGKVAAY